MKLIRLTLKNFMPYKGETVLEFPQDPDCNTLIVLGDNMRGKTSLLNGIRWAFYAKAQGRHLRPIPLHLMPNREAAATGDWSMEARIEFEADGCRYDLRREAKKRQTVAHPDRPEDFQVFAHLKKDGAAVAANEIEAEINKFAPEQVSRFFLFDGELLQEYEELLIEGSEQGKKIKDAIEQALGVPALTKGRDDLQVLWKRAQKEQGREAALVAGLEAVSESFAKWSSRRDLLDANLVTLKTQHARIKEERLALEDAIAASQQIYAQKMEFDVKVSRKSEISWEIKQRSEARLALVADAWRDLVRVKLTAKRFGLQSQMELASRAATEIARIQFQIEHLSSHLTASICQTCGQSIKNQNREAQQKQINELTVRLATIEKGGDVEAIGRELRALDKVLTTSVRERILDADKEMARLEVEGARVESRIDELQSELDGKGAEETIRKRQQLMVVNRDEAKNQVEIDDCDRKVAEADREIQSLTQRMNAQAGKNTSKAAQIAKAYESLYLAFTASIDNLRSSLRSTVERNATEAFLAMSTQKSYKGLAINVNYGLTILDSNGDSVPLRSAGAEQIVALSLIDGLSRSGRAAGPVVMDTPFGRLDTKHRQNILSYLPDSARQLVLFVHDGEMGEGPAFEALAHRIGARYEIKEVTPNHSVLERTS